MRGLVIARDFLDKGKYYGSVPENRVSSTFPPISLVSPLPLNRIMSNLVSKESPYQGKSSDIGYKMWGQVSIEDISDYRNSSLWIRFKILLHSKSGSLQLS